FNIDFYKLYQSQLKYVFIPIAESKDIFELRQSCRDSTIVNGIVLIQYNAIYDRRIATLSRAQICIYFLRLVLFIMRIIKALGRILLSATKHLYLKSMIARGFFLSICLRMR